MSLALAAASVQRPGPKAAVAKAAALVRDAREAAGLTLDDLGAALDLKDPTFMALVESGKVGLPFEMILRLATILGRNDPITFILQLTRSYNPRVWKSLEALGIGKLLRAGRPRARVRQHLPQQHRRAAAVRQGLRRGAGLFGVGLRKRAGLPWPRKKPEAAKAEPAKAR